MKVGRILAATLVLASSSVFAGGMSCFVDSPAYDEFTPDNCETIVWGARTATAVFRIDNLPARYHIDWEKPACADNLTICSVSIRAFFNYTAKASVIDLDAGTVTEVSAVARFEDGR